MTAKEYMIDRVSIPNWVVTLILPMIVGAIIGLGTYAYSAGEVNNQIHRNTLEIDKKVNYQPEFVMVMKTLERIELKLDTHIDKDKS